MTYLRGGVSAVSSLAFFIAPPACVRDTQPGSQPKPTSTQQLSLSHPYPLPQCSTLHPAPPFGSHTSEQVPMSGNHKSRVIVKLWRF